MSAGASISTEPVIEPKPAPTGAPGVSAATSIWHATIPANQCSFAIIVPSSLGVPAPSLRLLRTMIDSRSPALDEALQRWLPVGVEEVHAAYALVEPRSASDVPLILACAVDRATLQQHLASGMLTAAPASLPAALADRLGQHAPRAASLNLLVGDLQPAALRAARRRTRMLVAASVLITVGLLILGLSRRAAHAHDRADALLAAVTAVELRSLPSGSAGPTDPVRTRLRLTSEIARLRSAAAAPADRGIDAAATLAELLSRWPREGDGRAPSGLYARLHSAQVISTGISLTVVIPADADPEPILAGLRSLPGWQLQPTQRSSAPLGPSGKAEARLNLRLVPTVTNPRPT